MGYHTIILKGDLNERYEEGRAGGTITPGHIIKLNSSDQLVVHGTAGGFGETAVAIEDALRGKTIDDNYTSGDLVRYQVLQPGDVFYALLPAAATAVVVGDQLISNGDGCLKKTTGSPTKVFGIALEAVDNSGGSGTARIKCRVM